MFEVFFYQDKNGNAPFLEYLRELTRKTDKSSRIKQRKYKTILNIYGRLAHKRKNLMLNILTMKYGSLDR